MVNYMLGQTLYPITLDFTDYSDRGSQIRIPSSTLTKRVLSQLNQSSKVSTIKPDTLELIYTRGEGKKVPVQLRGEAKAERQYYISDIIYLPDSVMVYAPKEILDTIQAAYTEALDIEEISDTARHRVNMIPVKGARFTPSYSDVTFLVDMYSEKTVEVPVVGVGFPEDKVLRTFPSKVHVTFQIGLSQFENVASEDFKVVVDYQILQKEKGEKCRPILVKSPSNVNHVRISPLEIDYIIEQKVIFND